MNNKKLKRLMTDVAKGKITKKEADKIMNPTQKKPGKKRKLNTREVK